MADAHEGRNHKLDERGRLIAFSAVWKFLSDKDQRLALAGALDYDAFISSPEYKQSPITRGADFILESEELLQQFPNQTRDAVRSRCQKWFREIASHNSQSSFADMKRATKGDWHLEQEDFDKIADVLTTVQYEDDSGNLRYFESIESLLTCCTEAEESAASPEERLEAGSWANIIREVKRKAHGKAAENLDVIKERLREKCGRVSHTSCSHPLHACTCASLFMHACEHAQRCMHAQKHVRAVCNVPSMSAASTSAKSTSSAHASVRRHTSVRDASLASSPCWSTSSAKSTWAPPNRATAQSGNVT